MLEVTPKSMQTLSNYLLGSSDEHNLYQTVFNIPIGSCSLQVDLPFSYVDLVLYMFLTVTKGSKRNCG